MQSDAFQRMLTRCPIFADAPAPAARTLAVNLERRNYGRGKLVYAEGKRSDRMYIIISGQVMLTRAACDVNGHRLLAIRRPTETFGEIDFLGHTVRATSAVARTDLFVLAIGRRRLHGWIRRHPEVGYAMLRELSREQRRSYRELCHLRCADLPGRLAKLLLQCWKDYGEVQDDVCTVKLGMTHRELADQVGACRDQVRSVLARFRQQGWIRVDNGVLYIQEPEKLTRYVTER